MRWFSFAIIAAAVFTAAACKSGKLNVFTPQQDLELGRQVSAEIESNRAEYPILPEQGNEEVYRYVRGIVNKLLSSGKVAYRSEFAWQVKIIKDDKTLNAFATPGGFIYVYTGLIKFLASEDELAGVLGHEIAHSAQRHSTQQMTQVYGISALLSIVTGKADPGLMQQIAVGLLSLRFSRGHETEADTYSVVYLCETSYNAAGAAGFFEKIEGQAASGPEFLSTHPNPGNRIEAIKAKARELGCRGTATNRAEYERIKQLIR
jgi:predicted Zn-dependent protease